MKFNYSKNNIFFAQNRQLAENNIQKRETCSSFFHFPYPRAITSSLFMPFNSNEPEKSRSEICMSRFVCTSILPCTQQVFPQMPYRPPFFDFLGAPLRSVIPALDAGIPSLRVGLFGVPRSRAPFPVISTTLNHRERFAPLQSLAQILWQCRTKLHPF